MKSGLCHSFTLGGFPMLLVHLFLCLKNYSAFKSGGWIQMFWNDFIECKWSEKSTKPQKNRVNFIFQAYVDYLSEALSYEVSSKGVTIQTVDPSYVCTGMTEFRLVVIETLINFVH